MSTYRNFPGCITTGVHFTIPGDLKPGFETACPMGKIDSLDAPQIIPAGSVKFSPWGPPWAVQPFHQVITTLWRDDMTA